MKWHDKYITLIHFIIIEETLITLIREKSIQYLIIFYHIHQISSIDANYTNHRIFITTLPNLLFEIEKTRLMNSYSIYLKIEWLAQSH